MKKFKNVVLAISLCSIILALCSCALTSKDYTPTDESYFIFSQTEGGYSISAKTDVQLPENVVIPKTYNNQSVVAIADQGFYAQNVKSVKIPQTVKHVGSIAFSSCPNLEKVIILEGTETIGDFAFYSCPKLVSCELPESLISIGISSFQSTRIADVDLRKNVKSIGKNCFKECTNIGSVYIGKSVEIIGEGAFEGCPDSVKFTVSDLNEVYTLVDGKVAKK